MFDLDYILADKAPKICQPRDYTGIIINDILLPKSQKDNRKQVDLVDRRARRISTVCMYVKLKNNLH